MALDPNIALMVKPPAPPPSPLQTYASMLNVQNAQAQQQENQLKIGAMQRQTEDEEKAKAILQQSVGPDGTLDHTKAIQSLLSEGLVDDANKVQQQRIAADTNGINKMRADLDKQKAQINVGQPVIQSMLDRITAKDATDADKQDAFNVGKQRISQIAGPDLSAYLGDAYDPNTTPQRLKQIAGWTSDVQDELELKSHALTWATTALANEAQGEKNLDAWKNSWVNTVATTTSQSDYDTARNIALQHHVPQDIVDMYGSTWTPDLQKKAYKAAIPPEKQEELAARERERQTTQSDINNRHTETLDERERARLDKAMKDAEQFRYTEMLRLNAAHRKMVPVDPFDPTKGQKPQMSDQEFNDSVSALNDTYQRMRTGKDQTPAEEASGLVAEYGRPGTSATRKAEIAKRLQEIKNGGQ